MHALHVTLWRWEVTWYCEYFGQLISGMASILYDVINRAHFQLIHFQSCTLFTPLKHRQMHPNLHIRPRTPCMQMSVQCHLRHAHILKLHVLIVVVIFVVHISILVFVLNLARRSDCLAFYIF